MQWLGHHSNTQQDLVNLAGVWAPGQDMSNPDSWKAPILTALKCSHALLLADYECTEWGPAAGLSSTAAPFAIAGPADSQIPPTGGARPSKPPSALASLVLPPLSMLFESSQGKGRRSGNLEAQQNDCGRPPAESVANHCAHHAVKGTLPLCAWSCRAWPQRGILEAPDCTTDPGISKGCGQHDL